MQYKEYLPSPFFSRFIECHWELTCEPGKLDQQYDVWAPDCTFELIFSASSFYLYYINQKQVTYVAPGSTIIGQKTGSVFLDLKKQDTLFGIRFKPFAFTSFFNIPLHQLNNKAVPLSKFFPLSSEHKKQICQILKEKELPEKVALAEALILQLWEKQLSIDEIFRAQLNFILDRKGLLRIKELFEEFGISKVTLNKHFTNKMGLNPKMVSRIWRINYFLQLQYESKFENLTQLGLEAGFYDQAHFIKEFRAFFDSNPKAILRPKYSLLNISKEIITRRFTNQYDPR